MGTFIAFLVIVLVFEAMKKTPFGQPKRKDTGKDRADLFPMQGKFILPPKAQKTQKKKAQEVSRSSDKKVSSSAKQEKNSLRNTGMKWNMLEDRENDWLATELREEEKALRKTSDMFDLKMEHREHCASEYLKEAHERNCSAERLRRDSLRAEREEE